MKRLLSTFVLLFAFTGCASLGGTLGGVLQQLGGLASGVTDWQKMLPAALGGAELEKLSSFVGQAGDMKDTLMGALSGAQDATKNGFSGVLGSLTNMADTDVSQLQNASEPALRNAINSFGANASDLGQSVTQLLDNGIPGLKM